MSELYESPCSARVHISTAGIPIDMLEVVELGSSRQVEQIADHSVTIVWYGWTLTYYDALRRFRIVPIHIPRPRRCNVLMPAVARAGRFSWCEPGQSVPVGNTPAHIGPRTLTELAALELPRHYAIDIEVVQRSQIVSVGTVIRGELVVYAPITDPDFCAFVAREDRIH